LFSRRPPSVIYQFIERVVFYAGDTDRAAQPGWSNEAFAWFVWRHPYHGPPVVKWLHVDDGKQQKMAF